MNPIENFWSLCKVAQKAGESTSWDSRSREPSLLSILNLVKDYPELQDKFAFCFIHLFHWPDLGPFDIIEYCMAELRWPAVQQHLEGIVAVTPEINCRAIAIRILAAFRDHWPTGAIYARYVSRSQPAAISRAERG